MDTVKSVYRYLTPLAQKAYNWEIVAAVIAAPLVVASIQTWIEDSPADESFVIWLLAHTVVTGCFLFPIVKVVQRRIQRKNAKIIAERLEKCSLPSLPLTGLDRYLSMKSAADKIKRLQKNGLLQGLSMDDANLILIPNVFETAASAEPNAENDIICQIRTLNDRIDDAEVSDRIDRIESIIAGIIAAIEQKPQLERDAHRFMKYYLPTTLKLLESYAMLEKQNYQGENIQSSRRRIEAALDTIVAAAEKQQDSLFEFEAMNVDAEIKVLETILMADGLTKSDNIVYRTQGL